MVNTTFYWHLDKSCVKKPRFFYFTPFFISPYLNNPTLGALAFQKVTKKSSYPFNRQSSTKVNKYQIEYSKLVEAFYLLVNARLTFILRDVLYMHLPNNIAVLTVSVFSIAFCKSWRTQTYNYLRWERKTVN